MGHEAKIHKGCETRTLCTPWIGMLFDNNRDGFDEIMRRQHFLKNTRDENTIWIWIWIWILKYNRDGFDKIVQRQHFFKEQ